MNYKHIYFFFMALTTLTSYTLLSLPHEPLALQFLFILYDAGETNALLPVIQKMDTQQRSYRVLVMGTARHEVKKGLFDHKNIIDLNEDAKILTVVDNTTWLRRNRLSEKEIDQITSTIHPHTVVTGVVSSIQYQIAAAFKSTHASKVVGYYDNLYYPVASYPDADVVQPFVSLSDLFLVPSNDIAIALNKPHVHVVGNPSLETWVSQLNIIGGDQLRKILALPITASIICYSGGYGKSYEDAFKIFAHTLPTLNQCYRVVICPHPKTDGSFERNTIAALTSTPKNSPLILSGKPSTMEVIAAADIVVCHQSTTGVQALFACKPVIYIDNPTSSFTNFAIEKKLSSKVTTARDFLATLDILQKKDVLGASQLYHLAGIPEHATEALMHVLGT